MANSDIVTSKMGGNDCFWRTLTMKVLDGQSIAAGATFTTEALFLVDNGYSSLHTIMTGANTLLDVSYECDNSNVDANFAAPYVDGASVGALIVDMPAENNFFVLTLAPSMRKRFIFHNKGTGAAVVSAHLNMVLKNE